MDDPPLPLIKSGRSATVSSLCKSRKRRYPSGMTAPLPTRPLLETGELIPWFRAKALSGSDAYAFDTAAGRHILLLLCGTAGRPESMQALRQVFSRRSLFDDEK